MGKYFGTDGIRGKYGEGLTDELAFTVGAALGRYFGGDCVIGRDTRLSGEALEDALVQGVVSTGVNVQLAGILPTPAVSMLTKNMFAACGVIISASHNPPEYNGIKIFGRGGVKLNDKQEEGIEYYIDNPCTSSGAITAGYAYKLYGAAEQYINRLTRSRKKDGRGRLDGIKVWLDCGFGAAGGIAYEVFSRLGARVVSLNDNLDGAKINTLCGALYIDRLRDIMNHCNCRYVNERGIRDYGFVITNEVINDKPDNGEISGCAGLSNELCGLNNFKENPLLIKPVEGEDNNLLEEERGIHKRPGEGEDNNLLEEERGIHKRPVEGEDNNLLEEERGIHKRPVEGEDKNSLNNKTFISQKNVETEAFYSKCGDEAAALGFAFDGDADRMAMVYGGRVLDGDSVLYSLSRTRHLKEGTVVGTVMSNLALQRRLTAEGKRLLRTNVGDKHILDLMLRHGYTLGGEQSGHYIFYPECVSGDGVLAALKMTSAYLSGDAVRLELVPQKTVSYTCRHNALSDRRLVALTEEAETRLSRVLVRMSGTEPKIRIMAEDENEGRMDEILDKFAEVIAKINSEKK